MSGRGEKTQLWSFSFFFFLMEGCEPRERASQSQISEGWLGALRGHVAACGLRWWSGGKKCYCGERKGIFFPNVTYDKDAPFKDI